MRSLIAIGLVLILTSPALGSTFKHPASGHAPKRLPSGYGTANYGFKPEDSFGEVKFFCPYPDPTTLTEQEQYMVAGSVDSDLGGALTPWYEDIFMMVNAICQRTGEIPAQLTHDLIKMCTVSPDAFDLDDSARWRSPITGEFPVLNATEFEPGQVYIRLLTEAEKRHFADQFEIYDMDWYQGVTKDYSTGEVLPIKLMTDIYYMRVYGEREVIYAGIIYRTELLELPSGFVPPTPAEED
jgi:hypothetical protein